MEGVETRTGIVQATSKEKILILLLFQRIPLMEGLQARKKARGVGSLVRIKARRPHGS